MASNNYQNLDVGKGESVVDGKIHWDDFIAVRIVDNDDAFNIAMQILRQYEESRFIKGEKPPVTFNLTGVLSAPNE